MIDGLKPYPAYKDSGVPWLGAVPEHWKAQRLRNVADMRVSNVDKHTKEHEEPVRLCNYVDVYKNDYIRPDMHLMRATATKDEIARFRLAPDDVLITKDSEAWNDIGVPALVLQSADDLISGYHLALLRPLPVSLSGGFLFRALQSTAVAYQFHVEANGVTRYGLSHAAIKSVWLPLPPLSEQSAIVRFLDHADRQINRYIRAKQKLIKLLEEQKQAVIHRAVTRGLDPNVRLKPSGVQWLGDVPGHWEVMRVKQFCRVQGGYAFPSSAFGDTGIPVVRMNNLRRGVLDLSGAVRIQDADCVQAFSLKAGDIVYGLSGSIGATGSLGNYAVVAAHDLPALLNQRVSRFVPKPGRIDPLFIVQLIQSSVFYAQVLADTTGTAQFNVSTLDIENVTVALPPLCEQERIVAAIEVNVAPLAAVISHLERQISLLREYRTRLIADVVTGKLDVREAAAKLPEETEDLGAITEDVLPDDETLDEGEGEADELDEEAA